MTDNIGNEPSFFIKGLKPENYQTDLRCVESRNFKISKEKQKLGNAIENCSYSHYNSQFF